MKCPNCGSEKIQFGTNTSGGGFSLSQSCCGSILLGPLGFLCGACGSGTTTEEFWICQECGNKFSNREGQKAQEKEADAAKAEEIAKENAHQNYLKNKQVIEEAVEENGSMFDIYRKFYAAEKQHKAAKKAYEDEMKSFIEAGDKKIKKLDKKANSDISTFATHFIAITLIAAVILLFVGMFVISIPLFALDLIIFLHSVIRTASATTKLKKLFLKENPDAKKLYEEMSQTEKEYEKWHDLKKKIDSTQKYERENNNDSE